MTNCNDSGSGSLRNAIASASSGDTISLESLACRRIVLTSGRIEIPQDDLTLIGRGTAMLIDGNRASSYRVLLPPWRRSVVAAPATQRVSFGHEEIATANPLEVPMPCHAGGPSMTSPTGSVLVAGSANLDFVVRAPHVPAPGETVLGQDFATFPGGKGANQAVACARAGGVETQMLVALGDDPFAAPLEQALTAAGVGLHIVRPQGQATGTAFICLADDAENAITVAPGANARLAPADLPSLEGIDYLLLQLETPLETVCAYAAAGRRQPLQVVLNAAPAQVLPAPLLALVDLLIVNEGELATISGCRGTVAEAMGAVDVPNLVVTLGRYGSCARIGGRLLLQPAFAVRALDTTGAGDTFCGALVARLAAGAGAAAALRFASAAAALACTGVGAQSSIPSHAQVTDFLAMQPPDEAQAGAALRSRCGFPAAETQGAATSA